MQLLRFEQRVADRRHLDVAKYLDRQEESSLQRDIVLFEAAKYWLDEGLGPTTENWAKTTITYTASIAVSLFTQRRDDVFNHYN